MKISASDLKPGMAILKPIYNENNVVIINEGKVLSENLINRILEYNIKEVEVVDFENENINTLTGDIYTTISQKLKNETIESLKKLNVAEIINNAKKIVNTILKSKDFNYSLLEYKRNNDVYNHCVRVAAFACVLAKFYIQEKNQSIDLNDLSVASLVHDLGKTLKDNEMKISLGNITDKLKERCPGIKNVPIIGYDPRFESFYTYCLLEQLPDISSTIKVAALLTSENEKGTGPLKADKNLINSQDEHIVISKIIRLCSVYDDMLKHTIEHNLPLENISSQLEMYSENGLLNKDLTNLFLKHVPLYSVGVKVKLSDNRYAIVIETFTERINNYKPKVKVVPTGEIIDLRYENALTVREICGDEISFAELVIRQIIDMNNGVTNIEQTKGRTH